jgi:orotate phosphoribosyltransferase
LYTKIEEEVAQILLDAKAIALRPSPPFKFTSGISSPIYCDNRVLLSIPDARSHIVNYYADAVNRLGIHVDVVAGVATASIPWAALLADRLGKPMIYVRKEPKGHGMENLIEGKLEKGQRVLIVEDLVSTGKSSIAAIEAVRKGGGIVDHCIAIFSYQMTSSKQAFSDAKCELHSLSNFSALVNFAANKGIIRKEDLNLVLEWSKSPDSWKST